MEYYTNDLCIDNINEIKYVLRISSHCKEIRDIKKNNKYDKNRTIENMTIDRINYIIKKLFYKFKINEKSLIVLNDKNDDNIKYFILLAKDNKSINYINFHEKILHGFTIISMLKTVSENMNFIKIPIQNRFYFEETYQDLLLNEKTFSKKELNKLNEEKEKIRLSKFYLGEENLKQIENYSQLGLRIVKKKEIL